MISNFIEGEKKDYYHIVGLGRDAVTKEFKILRFFNWTYEGYEYQILTLGPEDRISWRKLNGIYKMSRPQRPVYTNVALYWLDIGLGAKFIRFDFHTEEFQAINLPYPNQLSVAVLDINSVVLMCLRNSLCLAEKDIANSKLNVWSLIKDNMNCNSGGAWEELYSIPIDLEWKSCLSLSLCSITEHKDVIISINYSKNGMLIYNPRSKSCKYVKEAAKLKKSVSSTTHFESLVPLYGQNF
ncbi:hypothetical protein COLO4_15342 [Corchorus olitorius]|uniref:F-box associated beta-propeller type 1 domain-containing protein n=1 Tax=Corchorus olitorius TaxID=93759 RepID=A0A1R3JN77_9ROSI|nr:hypothetical protein COLO4_15342 [Corchorus olitorius]